MSNAGSSRPPTGLRYWPSWFAVALMWLLGKTPQRVALLLALPLGWLLRNALTSRRRIAERNVERCFPDWDHARRNDVLAGCFEGLARMLFEVAWAWSASDRFVLRIGETEGGEPLRQAMAEGRGVLLVTAHFTCLEIAARIFATPFDRAAGFYRPLRNPVIEWYQNRGRARYGERMIRKDDLRGAVRFLRGGGVLWYAPDQDFGADRSLFAPFFGISTATLTVTTRLARLADCRVVPMLPHYDRKRRKYVVRLYPELEDFPSGDDLADLTRINALIEEHVREAPEQYWWIHRRFKTRPEGEPPFYD